MSSATFWVLFGFLGQGMFALRFLVQWIASERRKRSHLPVAFWYLSLVGGLLTLAYAIHLSAPPFIIGQAAGLMVYVRNLVLVHRSGASAPTDGS
ncbi:MAG: lipid-A-disaccharide synthase N-terminal domain-containing protein [Acidobacteriota bacterium]